MLSNFIIQRLNGETYDMKNLGIVTKFFTIDSLSSNSEQENVDGKDGHVDIETVYEGRTMKAECTMIAQDDYDLMLSITKLYKILSSKESFYLTVESEPQKRWLVKAEKFTVERTAINHWGEFTVEFVSSFPFSESIGTTLDERTFEQGTWQVGQGLLLENVKYVHDTNEFEIYNAGDIAIDTRQMNIKIKYQGASDNLTITNNTTGDIWKYNGTSGVNDTILLDGIRAFKNNESIFADTNKRIFTLAEGFNEFTLDGTSGDFLISFDFRFYYI